MQDRDTQGVHRLYDFTTAPLIPPHQANCNAGAVNSADELHLVIESVRPDTKHRRLTSSMPMTCTGGRARCRKPYATARFTMLATLFQFNPY
jgi:hypothetical protein